MNLGIEEGDTPTLKVGFVTGEGMLQVLQARTGFEVVGGEAQVGVGIGKHILAVLSRSDFLIVLRNENIALQTSRQTELRSVVVRLGEGADRRQGKYKE